MSDELKYTDLRSLALTGATATVEMTDDPDQVILTSPDGSSARWHWHGADQRWHPYPAPSLADTGARLRGHYETIPRS